MNEIKYIQQIINKDEHSLETLIDNYSYYVAYIVKNILSNNVSKQDIEECIEDVFVYIWYNASKYDSTRSSVKTWITTCARYKALEYKRKICKKVNIVGIHDINEMAFCKNDTEEYVLNQELSLYLVNFINDFNEVDKKVFYYRYFLHMGIDEISNVLGLSRTAIDNRLWRCRKKMKKKLECI